ncbi:hypothetical protein F8271_28570, partial [Micromonospora sp. ALFpr18c]
MAWSIGHSLIVVLALLLGVAAGWLLRSRRDSGHSPSIVDGDPVVGLADIATPAPPATTDEARPAATIDPTPTAITDEPTPVDTVSAPAAVTTPDRPAPADADTTVDPADMALTEAPPPVPAVDPADAMQRRGEDLKRVALDLTPNWHPHLRELFTLSDPDSALPI